MFLCLGLLGVASTGTAEMKLGGACNTAESKLGSACDTAESFFSLIIPKSNLYRLKVNIYSKNCLIIIIPIILSLFKGTVSRKLTLMLLYIV